MKLIDSCLVCHRLLWNSTQICKECLCEFRASDILYRDLQGLPLFSLLHYVYPLEQFAKIWKSNHGEELIRCLALELALKFSSECLSPIKGVIPMPAKIQGAKDHAYLIAEVVAHYFKVPLANQFLERIEPQDAQKLKKLNDRKNLNVRLAADFKTWNTEESGDSLNSGVWLLIDDVATTGHTLYNAWNILGKPKALGLTLAATPLWALYREDFTKAPLKSPLHSPLH